MPIAPGTRFGPYEVLALVGAGAMGEVYRARDPRLGRDVALKVLPAAFCADRDRLRRFEQESKAAGALNHPNIVAIHDVGTEQGQPFLVSELLEGESLRQRLTRGPLPPRRAVEIAAQLAHGLAAAHARGILHRDIKPENLFLTREGRAKILDFGIAKLTQPGGLDTPEAPTVAEPRHTEVGAVIGTAGYMSPEQAQGLAVDHRSDLFALGAVLYEILSATRAFKGESHVSVLAAILDADPPDLPDAVPTAVQRIVRRCLEKDPEARFQSARDLAFALDGLTGDVTSTVPTTSRRASRRLGLALAAMAGLAVGAALGYTAETLRRSVQTELAGAPIRRFTFQPPTPLGPNIALSPDGTRLVWRTVGAAVQLHSRLMSQFDVEAMAGTDGGSIPFFAPDGRWIGFSANGKLKKVPAAGGAAVTIADVTNFLGASWGLDGNILVTRRSSPMLRVSSDGGTPTPVAQIDAAAGEIDHHTPSFLPGGTAFLFTIHAGPEVFRVAVRSLVTGEQRTLVRDGFNPRYIATGHIVYGRGSSLLAAAFDPQRLVITGPEVMLVENVLNLPGSTPSSWAIADVGTLAYVPEPSRAGRTLVWVDRAGKIEPLALPPRDYGFPSLSPDGQRLAVQIADGSRSDAWVYRLADGVGTRLGLEGVISRPQWTPDGAHLTLSVRRGDERFLIRQPVDGTGAEEVLVRSRRSTLWAGAWAPDGQALAFVDNPPTDINDIKILRRAGGSIESLVAGPAGKDAPSFSPDGRWIAYRSDDRGRGEIYVRPFQSQGLPRQISTEGGSRPRWSPTGREVFYLAENRRMVSVPIRTTPALDVGPPRVLFELPFTASFGFGPPSWDVTPDGSRFIMIKPGEAETASRSIQIVENWFEELRRRVKPGAIAGGAAK